MSNQKDDRENTSQNVTAFISLALRHVPIYTAHEMVLNAILRELTDTQRENIWNRICEERSGMNVLLERSSANFGIEKSQESSIFRQQFATIDEVIWRIFNAHKIIQGESEVGSE